MDDENFLLTSINSINDTTSGSLIQYNSLSGEYNRYDFVGHSFTRKSLSTINNQIFAFGDVRFNGGLLYLTKFNDLFGAEFTSIFNTPSGNSGSTYSIALNEAIYCLSVDEISADPFKEEITLFKFDSTGKQIWSKNFGQEGHYSFGWKLVATKDKNILLSQTIRFANEFLGYPRLLKIDTSGNILWETVADEPVDNGASAIWITELSDSSIVQYYLINRSNDPSFYLNGFNTKPRLLNYYNREGQFIRSDTIKFPRLDNVGTSQIKTGKGDYFFIFGRYYEEYDSPIKNYYGLLTKYSNQGDTIWQRRYRHPDFDHPSAPHIIKDINELDNGDIVILSSVGEILDEDHIWLFKVNAEGCYLSEECDDLVITTGVEEVTSQVGDLRVYPNPATDKLYIELPEQVSSGKLRIQDINGVPVFEKAVPHLTKTEMISTQHLPSGVYHIAFYPENRTSHVTLYRQRFVKI